MDKYEKTIAEKFRQTADNIFLQIAFFKSKYNQGKNYEKEYLEFIKSLEGKNENGKK